MFAYCVEGLLSQRGENMAAGGFGGLNLAARGTDISNDSIFARKQHLLVEDNICKWGKSFFFSLIYMLTELCEYDYKGVIKAAEHNFNTFLFNTL